MTRFWINLILVKILFPSILVLGKYDADWKIIKLIKKKKKNTCYTNINTWRVECEKTKIYINMLLYWLNLDFSDGKSIERCLISKQVLKEYLIFVSTLLIIFIINFFFFTILRPWHNKNNKYFFHRKKNFFILK